MPSTVNTVLLALHAAAFTAMLTASSNSPFALASPLAMPLPSMAADYAPSNFTDVAPTPALRARKVSRKSTSVAHSSDAALVQRPAPTRASYFKTRRQSSLGLDGLLGQLKGQASAASTHSTNLQNLASRSSTVQDNDYEFQQQSATELTGFHTSFLGAQSILSGITGDKGLANYDRTVELETILKGLVNANKDALEATYQLVNNIPGLGPILGPLVFQVKCIVDDMVLDPTEDLTDYFINVLKPILKPLIEPFGNECEPGLLGAGVSLLGLCL